MIYIYIVFQMILETYFMKLQSFSPMNYGSIKKTSRALEAVEA